MATYYVNSAATGANNGTSKTDAYTSLVALHTGLTLAGGDEVWLAHTHTETASGAIIEAVSASGANRGVRYRSMNFTGDVPTFGATIVPGANAITLHGLVEDIHFDNSGSANDLTLVPGGFCEYAGCKFSKQAGQSWVIEGSTNGKGIIRDCEFAGGTSYTLGFKTGSSFADWEMHRITFSGTKGTNSELLTQTTSTQSMRIAFYGTNLSQWDNVIDHTAGAAGGAPTTAPSDGAPASGR